MQFYKFDKYLPVFTTEKMVAIPQMVADVTLEKH